MNIKIIDCLIKVPQGLLSKVRLSSSTRQIFHIQIKIQLNLETMFKLQIRIIWPTLNMSNAQMENTSFFMKIQNSNFDFSHLKRKHIIKNIWHF